MKDTNCIFCKIANGEIPSFTIYEDDKFRVIFDLSPATKGHSIILPKDHFKNVFELSDEYAKEVMLVAKKVASAMKEVLNCDGLNILQNNEGHTPYQLFGLILCLRHADDRLSWLKHLPCRVMKHQPRNAKLPCFQHDAPAIAPEILQCLRLRLPQFERNNYFVTVLVFNVTIRPDKILRIVSHIVQLRFIDCFPFLCFHA